jgi:hypothetical protein
VMADGNVVGSGTPREVSTMMHCYRRRTFTHRVQSGWLAMQAWSRRHPR